MSQGWNKLLMVKVIWGSWSSWSATITVVPKGDGEKCLVIHYCTLNKVIWKFIAPCISRGYFVLIKWSKVLLKVGPASRIPPYSLGWILNTQNSIHLTIWKMQIHQSTFWTHWSTIIFPRTYDRCLKKISSLLSLTWMASSSSAEQQKNTLSTISKFSKSYGMHTYQWSLSNAPSSLKKIQ